MTRLRAPKHVVDISLRKEENPHGTGFAIEGGDIVTAAHVVMRPDRLKIITKQGQTVEATVNRIDEVRDLALLKPKEPLVGVPPLADRRAPPRRRRAALGDGAYRVRLLGPLLGHVAGHRVGHDRPLRREARPVRHPDLPWVLRAVRS